MADATLTLAQWVKYRDILHSLSETAAEEFRAAVWDDNGFFGGVGLGAIPREDLINYAYALVTKYSEGSTAVACEMYDAIAMLSGATVPPAVPAQTATFGEVAKTVNGVLKVSDNQELLSAALGRLVKQAGQDTTLQNALRDGAEAAWVPAGMTCAYCLTIASRGWQKVSKRNLKNGHAEHIHPNCDCAYSVRFDSKTTVEGYDPKLYKRIYNNAEGRSPKDKINAIRRDMYALEKEDGENG